MTYRTCPTCESPLAEARKELTYFASLWHDPPADDSLEWYEEVRRLVRCLGSLAEAGPTAAATAAAEIQDTPRWVSAYCDLAEEMTKETVRRLDRFRTAAGLWRERARKLGYKEDEA